MWLYAGKYMAEKGTRDGQVSDDRRRLEDRQGLTDDVPSRNRHALAPLYNPTKPRFFTIHMADLLGASVTVLATSP